MPKYSAFQIPPPKNWQDFESLCWDLWRRIWNDPGTQKNGRLGQSQCGVDVSGQCNGSWCGVQAKGKDNFADKRVTVAELTAEVRKAQQFKPALRDFILATTGPKDAVVEQTARELTDRHCATGSFSVTVLGLGRENVPSAVEKRKAIPRSIITRSSAFRQVPFFERDGLTL